MSALLSKHSFFLSGLLFLISQSLISWILRNVGTPAELMLLQTTLDVRDFHEVIERLGPENMKIYLSHYWVDFFHPIFYSVFLSAGIYQASLHKRTLFQAWYLAFPILTGVFDEIENLTQLPLVAGWISTDTILFYVGALAARAK